MKMCGHEKGDVLSQKNYDNKSLDLYEKCDSPKGATVVATGDIGWTEKDP